MLPIYIYIYIHVCCEIVIKNWLIIFYTAFNRLFNVFGTIQGRWVCKININTEGWSDLHLLICFINHWLVYNVSLTIWTGFLTKSVRHCFLSICALYKACTNQARAMKFSTEDYSVHILSPIETCQSGSHLKLFWDFLNIFFLDINLQISILPRRDIAKLLKL